MPLEMRLLGDTYVRSEFKLHKPVTNEAQLGAFFVAWEQYLDQMAATARRRGAVETGVLESNELVDDAGFGQQLPFDLELSDEQKTQLEKLREETARDGKNVP
jgi:hypothetical protein